MKTYRPEIVDGVTEYRHYIQLRDQKANGTDGGTFTSGAWRTRTLNTIVQDDTGEVTLSSNQFTLPAGTYLIRAQAPSWSTLGHKARLRDMTNGSTLIHGTTEYQWYSVGSEVSGAINSSSKIKGRFTISTSTTFEIQHRCESTQADIGYGNADDGGLGGNPEIYTTVFLWKIR